MTVSFANAECHGDVSNAQQLSSESVGVVVWIARQTRSGVAGMSMWLTPNSDKASTTALIKAASAGVVPPSPPGRMPKGCELAGYSVMTVLIGGMVSLLGMA